MFIKTDNSLVVTCLICELCNPMFIWRERKSLEKSVNNVNKNKTFSCNLGEGCFLFKKKKFSRDSKIPICFVIAKGNFL